MACAIMLYKPCVQATSGGEARRPPTSCRSVSGRQVQQLRRGHQGAVPGALAGAGQAGRVRRPAVAGGSDHLLRGAPEGARRGPTRRGQRERAAGTAGGVEDRANGARPGGRLAGGQAGTVEIHRTRQGAENPADHQHGARKRSGAAALPRLIRPRRAEELCAERPGKVRELAALLEKIRTGAKPAATGRANRPQDDDAR